MHTLEFSENQKITMGGMWFTCPTYSGITTNLFPSPQRSYIVDQIIGNVGTSKTSTTGSTWGHTSGGDITVTGGPNINLNP